MTAAPERAVQGLFQQDFEHYREAWQQPGAPTGMYRALRTIGKPIGNPTIELPVKILWGAQDRFLATEMAELSLGYCPKGQLTLLPEASHSCNMMSPPPFHRR